MSQAKVDRYKEEKKNRKKTMKKEKRQQRLVKFCGVLAAIVVVGWVGYSGYNSFVKGSTAAGKTYSVDTAAIHAESAGRRDGSRIRYDREAAVRCGIHIARRLFC